MGIVLSVYGQRAFCEYLLPAENNMDYELILPKTIFSFTKDIILDLEVIEKCWYLKQTDSYVVTKAEGEKNGALRDGDIIQISDKFENKFSVIVREFQEVLDVFHKYDISAMQTLTIGAKNGKNIVYQYLGLVSGDTAVLRRNGAGICLEDESRNGIFVNGIRVEKQKELNIGDCINIFGLKIVYLGNVLAISAPDDNFMVWEGLPAYKISEKNHIEKGTGRKSYFHRAPRNYVKPENDAVEIEAPPTAKEMGKRPLWLTIGPSFTMMIPMLAGSILMIASARSTGQNAGLYMYTGLITAVGSAVIGVYWAITNLHYNKKEVEEGEEHRFQAYSDYLVNRTSHIREIYEKSRDTLLTLYPDAETLTDYNAESAQLWNRNQKHEDFLSQRVGIGNAPFQMDIRVPKERFTLSNDELSEKPQLIKEEYQTLYDVPITVDLQTHRLIGIVGGSKKKGAYDLVRIITAQIAANNCYTDVKLLYVYDKSMDEENWDYAKWLPHVWSEDKKIRYVASTKKEASDVFFELTQILRIRAEEENPKKDIVQKPYYVLVVSDMSLLEGELVNKYIFDTETNYGLTTLILADSMEKLPNECEYFLENDSIHSGIYSLTQDERQTVKFDTISASQMEKFARKLLHIEVKEEEKGRDIPDSLTFFEMENIQKLSDLHVQEKWRKNRTYDNMKAVIGAKAGGAPCYLDVHEKYHGPHGLVAGTTGSGKSETLQTYMLSLAINFSPDDIAYFIIDYKGDGMANLFKGLPHMIGSISNLSGTQVRRAMISIKSENRRRQRIFNENHVNNINTYTQLYKNGEASIPLPHLFIIIDEFAQLKKEEPEFMGELISVAQVGRSLGVHLILATQTPNGTVDENIWSNSKFRLCLRVQDRQNSNDMLHKPDAAYITQAGRGYLQVGNDEIYELFQSGYSGAAYREEGEDSISENAIVVSLTGKDQLIGSGTGHRKSSAGKEKTQLEAVKDYLALIAKEENYNYRMQLWLPLLPEALYLDQLKCQTQFFDGKEWNTSEQTWSLRVPVGLYDDPVNQAQNPVVIDFARNGHLAVCGSVVSGKSVFLQTMLVALIEKYTPGQLNIYMLDFSNHMLSCFEHAPHVGGIMYEEDQEKIEKFFYMMEQIMDERKKTFNGGSYAQYVALNPNTMPAILIVIDNIGAFHGKMNDKYDNRLLRLSKEGINYGIFLAISAAGFQNTEIPIKMGDNIKTVVGLQLTDKYAYMDALHSTNIDVLPENGVKGRGLVRVGDDILEFQTALAQKAEDDFKRLSQIDLLCLQMKEAWKQKSARKIPVVPDKPVWGEFEQRSDVQKMYENGCYLPIGYDMASAGVYGIDMGKTFIYLISGRARAGKTNTLKAILRSASHMNGKIAVIELDGVNLKGTAAAVGADYIDTEQKQADYFNGLVKMFQERNAKKRSLVEDGFDDLEIYDAMREFEPLFIVIKDIASFVSTVTSPKGDILKIANFVQNIVEKGRLHNVFIFAGINPDTAGLLMGTKLYDSMVGYHVGMHLGSATSNIRYLDFSNISYAELNKMQKTGVALIPAGNEEATDKIMIPFVKGVERRTVEENV